MKKLQKRYKEETGRDAHVEYNRSGYSDLYVEWLETNLIDTDMFDFMNERNKTGGNEICHSVSGSAIDKMKKDFLKQAANDLTA